VPNIPTKDQNPSGFYAKYEIRKIDGRPVDTHAEYFVLRLDDEGEPAHVRACRAAIVEYARNMLDHIPQLAQDLLERYGASREEGSA